MEEICSEWQYISEPIIAEGDFYKVSVYGLYYLNCNTAYFDNYSWEWGRQLSGITGNGKTIGYRYNDGGIRTQKTVNSVATNYHLVGDKVTYENNGSDNVYYTYDSSGHLVSMNLTCTTNSAINGEYYYIRNAQGDRIGLVDKNGTQVVTYTYDSWGKPFPEVKDANGNVLPTSGITGSLASTVGVKNSYRYRGYRYDSETCFYYLQSRYYSPEWGRFINADALGGSVGDLLSHNVFVYCQNDPINHAGPNGFIMTHPVEAWDGYNDEYTSLVTTTKKVGVGTGLAASGILIASGVLVTAAIIAEGEAIGAIASSYGGKKVVEKPAVGGNQPEAEAATTSESPKVNEIVNGIKDFLGENAKGIRNWCNDLILQSEDGLKHSKV